jgi:hypothetical protein
MENPDSVKTLKTLKSLQEQYLETLSEKERKSYEIAKEHLGMSFQLDKSVGYLKWVKTQTN